MTAILVTTLQIAQLLLWVLKWIVIIHAILSWLISFNVISRYNEFVSAVWNALDAITRPIYRPIRRLLPDFGTLDLTPLVLLLILVILDNYVLSTLIAQLAVANY